MLVLEDPACSTEQNLGWIRATHVCQFWRRVALDDSSLWATISSISPNTEFIFETLARARNAPLNIDIQLDGGSGEEVLRMLPPHLSHTRELRLHGPSILYSGGVLGIYNREAPALEYFELKAPVKSAITFRDLGGTTLFKGQALRLRTLSLSQVLIPWSLIPRGQLTQLKIVLFKEVLTAEIPSHGYFNQSIDLLVSCPRLEILALGRCLPFQLDQFPHSQTIHLPCLSRLFLIGSTSHITNLMKKLKLPSSTRLHLRCTSENISTHNGRFLLPVVSSLDVRDFGQETQWSLKSPFPNRITGRHTPPTAVGPLPRPRGTLVVYLGLHSQWTGARSASQLKMRGACPGASSRRLKRAD